MLRNLTAVLALIVGCALCAAARPPAAQAQAPAPFEYISPRPGAQLVSPATTIVIRPPEGAAPAAVTGTAFRVRGAVSGAHAGSARLADDGRTVVFTPARPFAAGERVDVTVDPSLLNRTDRPAAAFSFASHCA